MKHDILGAILHDISAKIRVASKTCFVVFDIGYPGSIVLKYKM